MFYPVTKGGSGKSHNYREFIISSASDVSSLPTSVRNANGEIADVGSLAYTENLTHVYQLGPDNVWREV